MSVKKAGFEEGELVTMQDIENCKIVKLMSMSVKLKLPNGGFKIAPYAIISKQDRSEEIDDNLEELKKVKGKVLKDEKKKSKVTIVSVGKTDVTESSLVDNKKPVSKRRKRRMPKQLEMEVTKEVLGKPLQQSFLYDKGEVEATKKSRRRKPVAIPKKGNAVNGNLIALLGPSQMKKTIKASKSRLSVTTSGIRAGKATAMKGAIKKAKSKNVNVIVYKTKPDEASTYLSGTKVKNVLIAKMRKHPAFVAINIIAFNSMRKQKEELSLATFKMRCLNMLRAAMRKM